MSKPKNLLNYIIPPPNWRFSVVILMGIIVGLGIHILNPTWTTTQLSYIKTIT